jgi:hypothetical protein
MSEQQKHVLEAVQVNPNDGQITGEVPAAIVTTYITRIEPFVIWMERRGLRASNFIMEFLGVFFLVFTVGCNVGVGSSLAPLSIGVILCSVIYSGGTYNIFCLFLICNKDRTNLISKFLFSSLWTANHFLSKLAIDGIN